MVCLTPAYLRENSVQSQRGRWGWNLSVIGGVIGFSLDKNSVVATVMCFGMLRL